MKSYHLLGVAATLTLLYFLLGFHPLWDIDVFWHIAAGRWIVAHGTLPTTDIFSAVDPARPWVTFQWLYEVLVHGLDRYAGLWAVRGMHAAAVAAALGFWCWWVGRRQGLWVGLVSAAILAVLFADRLRARPDAFNLLFMVAFWPLLGAESWSRGKVLWLALLASVWACLHAGGALLLPILLSARVAGRAADGWLGTRDGRWRGAWRRCRADLPVLAGLVVLMGLMPGFLRGTYQAFFMLGPSESFIPEWMTTVEFLWDHAGTAHEFLAGGLPLGLLVLLLAVTGRELARGRTGPETMVRLALALPLVFLSLRHVRFLWLGAFLVPMLAPCFHTVTARWPGWRRVGSVLLALGLLVLDGHYHVVRNGGGLQATLRGLSQDLEPGEFPVAAADFLVESGFSGRILNHAAWGGYLLYRLYPRALVYTDGRGNFGPVETQLLATWDDARYRRQAISRAWLAAPFEAVVHPDPFPMRLADCRDWVMVHHDAVAQVYLRTGERNLGNFKSMGAGLPDGVTTGVSQTCALHEALVRRSALRRLLSGEKLWPRLVLAARLAQGDQTARLPLAAQYFDLGDYDAVLQLLPPASRLGDANARFLAGFALLAQGRWPEARAILMSLSDAPGINPKASAILPRVLPVISAP